MAYANDRLPLLRSYGKGYGMSLFDEHFIDAVEQKVGMGSGAWDMVPPADLCDAVMRAYWERVQLSWAALPAHPTFADYERFAIDLSNKADDEVTA